MLGTASVISATEPQCFCPSNQPLRCVQQNDHSCILPVKASEQETACNPEEAEDFTNCVCAAGSVSCADHEYSLEFSTQPALASPMKPFGTQPSVRLLVNGATDTGDSETVVRISIANVASSDCGCSNATPCQHDNVGDNTCFAKADLFGSPACPAGTSECMPDQTNVQMYRVDPNDDSVEVTDKQCRNSEIMAAQAGTDFCSDEIPCKHLNDGTCLPKVSFNPAATNTAEPEPSVDRCIAQDAWRLAEPSKAQGWFFETDPSCDLLDASVGCSTSGQYYAMDKWCEHNCHPANGQQPFCPESHCNCDPVNEAPATGNVPDWRCPVEKYSDPACRCSAGTEQCGSIEVTLVNGVANFEHLTIGTPGKYTLRVEVLNPEPLTNRMQLDAFSAVFMVAPPTSVGNLCRAQPQWREDDLDNSEVNGAGQAWFYEDGHAVKLDANGNVEEVEKVYAMDEWCKANHCADHTLISHCELVSEEAVDVPACTSNMYDSFGDCCNSGSVDGCGVCNGDGSTCTLEKYLSTFVEGGTDRTAAILATHRCDDVASPCLHQNDGTCVPKTMNSESEEIIGNEHYCYLDLAMSQAERDTYWKFGDWSSAEGVASMNTGTVESNANNDCFCPAGTTDTSPKLEVELDCVKQEGEATLSSGDSRSVFFYQNRAVTVYDKECESINGPAGDDYRYRTYEHAGSDGHSLCASHFQDPSGGYFGSGSCASPNPFAGPCVNDKVRCVVVGALTKAHLYKHCQCVNCGGQVAYSTLDNSDGVTPKFFNLEAADHDTSRIVTEGSGGSFTPKCRVLGGLFDCLERDAPVVSDLCRKDSDCNDLMDLLETCLSTGESLSDCIASQRSNNEAYADVTNAYSNSGCTQGDVAASGLSLNRQLSSETQINMVQTGLGGNGEYSGYSAQTDGQSTPNDSDSGNGLDAAATTAVVAGVVGGVAGVAILAAVAFTHHKRAQQGSDARTTTTKTPKGGFEPEL